MLALDKTGEVYDWVIRSLDNGEQHRNDLTLAIVHDKKIIGGVVYTVVNKICYLSIYTTSKKWCTRDNISNIFRVVFEDLNCKIAKSLTSAKNKKANKLMFGLRLRHEGHLRYARADGSHENVFSITENELKKRRWYRWAEQ